MLPRHARLPIKEFFSERKNGRGKTRAAILPHLVIRYRENDAGRNRFGILIRRGTERSAVARHLLKRRIADALRTWPNTGKDILVVPSSAIRQATAADIRAELAHAREMLAGSPNATHRNDRAR